MKQIAVTGGEVALCICQRYRDTRVEPLDVETSVELAVNVEVDGPDDNGGEAASSVHLDQGSHACASDAG